MCTLRTYRMKNIGSSPAILRKIGKTRPIKVVVLGQSGVGKSALTVRFITNRFIGEYASIENICSCTKRINSEDVVFEILDTVSQVEQNNLEDHIKWGDVFILMYSIVDRCSFTDVSRLKFLVNSYSRKRIRRSQTTLAQTNTVPVALVGNHADKVEERMVSLCEGQEMSQKLGCSFFRELSVRESIEDVQLVFEELYKAFKLPKRLVRHFSSSLSHVARKLSTSSLEDIRDCIDRECESPNQSMLLRRRKALCSTD